MRPESNMRVKRWVNSILLICLLALSLSTVTALAQQRTTLKRLEFVGLKKLSAEQVVAVSGLQQGQIIDAVILDKAADKLLQSGLFRRLSYRVRTADNESTVTFEVEESAINLPVVFENFVWFSDDQILAAVRRDLPFFNGTAPATGGTAEKIAAALQRLLQERRITGTVDFQTNVSNGKQELVFMVKGARVLVCSLRFPGASAISEAELIKISQPLIRTEYSKQNITAFTTKLLDPYRRSGHLRAEFQPLTFELVNSAQCPGGVAVTIPVEEGPTYRWAKSVWDGNEKLSVEELATALGMNPGDLADGVKIDNGLKNVANAYARRGYAAVAIQPSIEYDNAASLVTYRFKIDEGTRYFMGNLIITGLPPTEAEKLRSMWTLGTNAVFDDAYLDNFRDNALREFVRGLMQRSPTSARARIGVETRPDALKHTVDVVIAFRSN